MLIQQRQPFKNGWSNLWDVTVGGHASTGEDSATAANRELYEEIGCQMDFSEKRPALTIHWKNPGATKNAQGFDDYYLVRQNLDETQLKLQKEEVRAVKWASENEILKMIEDKTFIPPYMTKEIYLAKQIATLEQAKELYEEVKIDEM